MTIMLNGEAREWPQPRTVADLLTELDIDTRMVAVERNRLVVKRAKFNDTVVVEGDEIEIVSFVGGG